MLHALKGMQMLAMGIFIEGLAFVQSSPWSFAVLKTLLW